MYVCCVYRSLHITFCSFCHEVWLNFGHLSIFTVDTTVAVQGIFVLSNYLEHICPSIFFNNCSSYEMGCVGTHTQIVKIKQKIKVVIEFVLSRINFADLSHITDVRFSIHIKEINYVATAPALFERHGRYSSIYSSFWPEFYI